jgi:hypothetical protein
MTLTEGKEGLTLMNHSEALDQGATCTGGIDVIEPYVMAIVKREFREQLKEAREVNRGGGYWQRKDLLHGVRPVPLTPAFYHMSVDNHR